MGGLFVFLKRVLIVVIILALISPLFAHAAVVTVLHDLATLVGGAGGVRAPTVKVSP